MTGPVVVGARVFLTGPEQDDWVEVGTLDSVTFADADESEDGVLSTAEPVTLSAPEPVTMTFEIPGPPDANMAYLAYGTPEEPTYRIEVGYVDEPLPAPPRKRRRLTGKAYRIARRRYGRARKAWRRAGSPMVEHRIVVPHAHLTLNPDTVKEP